MGNTNNKATPLSDINNNAQTVYKIVSMGSVSDGRTSLLTRLAGGTWSSPCPTATIGVAHFPVQYKDCKFQLWDTPGCDRFDHTTLLFTPNARLLMITISCTDADTLSRAREWKQKLLEQYGAKKLPPIMLVLTKCDLDTRRVITKEQLVTLALDIKAQAVYEVSTETGDNINNFIPALHSLVTSQGAGETKDLLYYKNNGVEIIPVNEHNIVISGITQTGKKSCLTTMQPTGYNKHIVPPHIYQISLAGDEALNESCDGLLFVVDATNINSLLGCGQLLTIELARLSSNSAPKFLIVNKCHDRDLHVITQKLLIKFAQHNHFCAVIEMDGLSQRLATATLPLLHQHFTQPASTQQTYYALSGATETYQYIFSFNHPSTIWFPSNAELRSDNLVRTLQPRDYCAQAALRRQIMQPHSLQQNIIAEQQGQREIAEQQQREIVEQQRQREIAEQQRQREIAEQQRQREIVEQQRQREIDEQQRQREIAEQQRQREIAEQQRQRESDEAAHINALPDDEKCQICFASDNLHVTLPCGHYPICITCVSKCDNICPTCRGDITSTVKLYSTIYKDPVN